MARRHHLPHLTLVNQFVEARVPAEHGRLVEVLTRLANEDPTFEVFVEPDVGDIIVAGTSEAHLKAKAQAVSGAQIDIAVGASQVYYRECLTRPETIDYTHKRQQGGAGQFARVKIQFAPSDDRSAPAFKHAVRAGALLAAHIAGVEKGLAASFENGVIAGFPLVDSQAILLDGAYHEVDSNALTFEIAARAAFRELRHTGAVVLLEPMMRVAVTCAREHGAAVARDLVDRQAEETKGLTGLTGLVPLATMLGYESDLERLIGERATVALTYDHHREVDGDDDPGRFRPTMAMRA